VNRIPAIDNHAHPVRFVAEGPPDREFDALPVDNMEPQSDPVHLRATDPGVLAAWRALWNYPYDEITPQHIAEWKEHKARIIQDKKDAYPAWILEKLGIDIMLANRVHMGPSIQPPHFRWVPYADALLFPLDNSGLAQANSDRRAFFTLEDRQRQQYLSEAGLKAIPGTLDDYLRLVITPALERHKQSGAIAEKFEIAYLRPFGFDKIDRGVAAKVYSAYVGKPAPPAVEYKQLQDFLFRYIAAECGRLGIAVHIHTMAGAGSYFDVTGVNPLLLESIFNDPDLRKTKFVMLHGGWPYTREITALLTKPNVYLDYSLQSLLVTPSSLAPTIRQWLEYVPEKVLFATDAYPYGDEIGWEESGWLAARRGREALAGALSGMMRSGEISRARALELAGMVLRENARGLYGF
jgi:predicted TIM-barrel fold metal-dependent hydrolase